MEVGGIRHRKPPPQTWRTERGPRPRIVAPLGELTGDQRRCWQRTAGATRVTWRYDRPRLRAALVRDGAYLLLSDQTDWTAEQLWATYMQLTRAEEAFRAMKSHLLLRPKPSRRRSRHV